MKHHVVALAIAALLAVPALRAQELDPALRALAEQEVPAVLETLRALTAPDSGTGQAEGMSAVADVIERFAKGLGGEVRRVSPASGVVGPNMVITFKGTGRRKVMLMSHMDTVYPAGTAAARPMRVEGQRAIAPGIADDKGGIAVFLHAMKLLQARGFRDYERVTMVFNSDEERGSAGSRELIRSQAASHDAVLSGEPTAAQEVIVLGTSGVGQMSARVRVGGMFGGGEDRPIEELADLILRSRDVQRDVPETRMNWTILRAAVPQRLKAEDWQLATLTFRVKGRASHAGNAPHLGVNAVIETASVVQRVSAAAARHPGVQVHWRHASGGLVGNVIPDRGLAVAEVGVPKGQDAAKVLEDLSQRGSVAMLPDAQVAAETAPGPAALPEAPPDAVATADMRVPSQEVFAELARAARTKAEARKFPASSITVQEGLGFPAYNANAEGKALAELARDIYGKLGGTLVLVPRTYGGTDAVWAAQSGKPVVENFGIPGGNYHSSEDEFVLVDRIARRVALAAEMIRAIAAKP